MARKPFEVLGEGVTESGGWSLGGVDCPLCFQPMWEFWHGVSQWPLMVVCPWCKLVYREPREGGSVEESAPGA